MFGFSESVIQVALNITANLERVTSLFESFLVQRGLQCCMRQAGYSLASGSASNLWCPLFVAQRGDDLWPSESFPGGSLFSYRV